MDNKTAQNFIGGIKESSFTLCLFKSEQEKLASMEPSNVEDFAKEFAANNPLMVHGFYGNERQHKSVRQALHSGKSHDYIEAPSLMAKMSR